MAFNIFFLQLLFVLSLIYSVDALATCYAADGVTIAPDHIPCDSTAETSSCCRSDAFCTDSGLCFREGHYARGSCTDRNWGQPCNRVCSNLFPQGSGFPVVACSTDNTFACGFPAANQTVNVCLNNFTLPGTGSIVLRVDQVAGLGITTPLTLAPTATVPSSSCAATVTAGLRFSTVLADIVCFLVTMSVSPTSPASTSSAMSGNGSGNSQDVGAIAGGTIGGVAAVVILIGAIYFLFREWKKGATREGAEMEQRPQAGDRSNGQELHGDEDRLHSYDPGHPRGPGYSELDSTSHKSFRGPNTHKEHALSELDTWRSPAELAGSELKP